MDGQIETIAFDALSDADRAAWLALRDGNPELESPYHHPDYHAAVDRHFGPVQLTIYREDGLLRAVLPWQGKRFGRPSGAPFSDYQAVIGEMPIEALLKSAPIGCFRFSAMPSDETSGIATSRCEISDPETWRQAQNGSYRRHRKSNARRIRKAEDEVGERRTVFQSRDAHAYDTLMDWKTQKFSETGKYNVLGSSGAKALLRALWDRGPEAPLRADMQVLYFGDRIAACDLGLTDGHVFHSWIIGYDPELTTYSPGIQLLEATVDAMPDLGYRIIDLGAGQQGYKRHYATHPRYVYDGVITVPSVSGWLSASYNRAEILTRKSGYDTLGKLRRRYAQIAACNPHPVGQARAIFEGVGQKLGRSPS